MDRIDRLVAAVLAAGVALILLAILMLALSTRVPLSHLMVDAQGAQLLRRAGVSMRPAPDWPSAYRVAARATDAAFTPTATLYFAAGKQVALPRRDVLLWVYRG